MAGGKVRSALMGWMCRTVTNHNLALRARFWGPALLDEKVDRGEVEWGEVEWGESG